MKKVNDDEAPYGWCPTCGAKGTSRNRGMDGLTWDDKDHAWYTCPQHGLMVGDLTDDKGQFKPDVGRGCLCPTDGSCHAPTPAECKNAHRAAKEAGTVSWVRRICKFAEAI